MGKCIGKLYFGHENEEIESHQIQLRANVNVNVVVYPSFTVRLRERLEEKAVGVFESLHSRRRSRRGAFPLLRAPASRKPKLKQ